ncbi:hypothetical protein CNEO_40026 [Clostridium neonatale]|uniref:Uncharacterized protein n=1 Tax=Clostridium neonatale TaxID=137838 RepID=A0AA86JG21_9CLOT|nr:hypothetical protein CNEO_40026 [Clostridium neonatale]
MIKNSYSLIIFNNIYPINIVGIYIYDIIALENYSISLYYYEEYNYIDSLF